MDKHHNAGLPPFLVSDGGVRSGLMIAQYTAAALVSENKVLIHPASGDSIPTSANQEDHVSMGTIAARQTREIIGNVRRILAIEVICASEAIERRRGRPGRGSARVWKEIRRVVASLNEDRPLSHDIEGVAGLIQSGGLNIFET
jgi:histidine ammonia-lyase